MPSVRRVCNPGPQTGKETLANSSSMSCGESTSLLQHQRGQHQGSHIIIVPSAKEGKDAKDGWEAKDYGPVFTTAGYSHGLTLEELLPFTLDPWWQKVRRLCLASVWLTFVLTLLASLSLAGFHNGDACLPNRVIATTLAPPTVSPLPMATNSTLLLTGL